MYILLVGLNHKTAPVEVREQLAFDSEASVEALKEFKQRYPNGEFVLLSTCNRVELYIAIDKSSKVSLTEMAACLTEMRGVDFNEFRKHLYIMRDQHVVRHLLAVTSSLDSMVIGENQISTQVRESYGLACDYASSGKVLNHLFHAAFAVSKKVFSQTSISSRRVSVAGVAVDLAKQLFDDIKSAKIVVLGAGEMGELLVEHFLHIKCDDITVINRTQKRGCTVALRHGIKAVGWDRLETELIDANIVVGAASANDGYLFDKKKFSEIMSKRRGRTLLAVDITVPRSFDPKINKLEGVYLYCIDDLSQVVEDNIKLREGDLEKAVEIICQGVGEYMEWFARRDIGPLIGKMKHAFDNIQKGEMEKFFAGDRQQASCKDVMDGTVSRVVNKILHCVIRNIDHVALQHSPTDAVKLAESILEHAENIIDEDNQKGLQ
ncbi:MAG: glutamyl-tRNA reductase [Planctomycetes bacterium]|nr:glutamyl-tRNA reductase [Planctomycetota bacterium]